jgi:hypothetical protein
MLWCSASQYRRYPHRSAARASRTVACRAWDGAVPDGIGERSSTDSGRDGPGTLMWWPTTGPGRVFRGRPGGPSSPWGSDQARPFDFSHWDATSAACFLSVTTWASSVVSVVVSSLAETAFRAAVTVGVAFDELISGSTFWAR